MGYSIVNVHPAFSESPAGPGGKLSMGEAWVDLSLERSAGNAAATEPLFGPRNAAAVEAGLEASGVWASSPGWGLRLQAYAGWVAARNCWAASRAFAAGESGRLTCIFSASHSTYSRGHCVSVLPLCAPNVSAK